MNDLERISVAVRLKEARVKAGIGLRELARRLGLSANGYRHYEQPHLFKSPYLPLDLAKHIARVCGDPEFARTVYELAGGYFEDTDYIPAGPTGNADNAPDPPIFSDWDTAETAFYGGPLWFSQDLVELPPLQTSDPKAPTNKNRKDSPRFAFSSNWLRSITDQDASNLSIMIINGETMEPTLQSGDVVLVNRDDRDLNRDGLFALWFNQTVHVKRVGRSTVRDNVMVISDNNSLYPPIDTAMHELMPAGRVLWFGRKL